MAEGTVPQEPAGGVHDTEVDVDEQLVLRLLTLQFPDWATLPLERVEGWGTVNAIFRLGSDMVVRLTRTSTDSDVDFEACWLRSLAGRLPLATPDVLAVGEPAEGYPWKWSVLRWLDGETWQIDRVGDPCAAAATLAEFVKALQQLEPATMPCPQLSCFGRLQDRDRVVRRCAEQASGVNDRDGFLDAWTAALRIPEWDGGPLVVHSDLSTGNVLVRDGRLVAVIDWAAVSVGDPARDLMPAWTLFSGDARRVFQSAMGFDDNTWARAQAWELLNIIPVAHYAGQDPIRAAAALENLQRVLVERSW